MGWHWDSDSGVYPTRENLHFERSHPQLYCAAATNLVPSMAPRCEGYWRFEQIKVVYDCSTSHQFPGKHTLNQSSLISCIHVNPVRDLMRYMAVLCWTVSGPTELSKYPRRHCTCQARMPGSVGFIFMALLILAPWGLFLVFFGYIWGLRPQITLGSPLWDQVRPHSIKKIGGRFYPTHATPSRTWPPSHARWGFLGTSVDLPPWDLT